MVPALTTMVILPFGQIKDSATGVVTPLILANVDVGVLFLFAVSSLGVYGMSLVHGPLIINTPSWVASDHPLR